MNKSTLFFINKTNLDKKIGKIQKRKKGRESPQGGWGMGLKEPIRNIFLLLEVTIS